MDELNIAGGETIAIFVSEMHMNIGWLKWTRKLIMRNNNKVMI